MKIIDLSHTMTPDMPVFPGTEQPEFHDDFTIEKDGFAEKTLKMVTHIGTHIDAPAHMVAGGHTLDEFPVDQYIGHATVLDVRGMDVIDRSFLKQHEEALVKNDFILFCTGWDQFWGDEKYFTGFPALNAPASAWLSQYNLKGVGVDAISIDAADVQIYAVHRNLLSKPMIIIENCRGLDALIGQSFLFSCLPLHIREADGSPVRAVAMLEPADR